MNTELYEQVRKGITHDNKGNPIRVTDAEMAEFVVESTKRKRKKSPQIFKRLFCYATLPLPLPTAATVSKW